MVSVNVPPSDYFVFQKVSAVEPVCVGVFLVRYSVFFRVTQVVKDIHKVDPLTVILSQ